MSYIQSKEFLEKQALLPAGASTLGRALLSNPWAHRGAGAVLGGGMGAAAGGPDHRLSGALLGAGAGTAAGHFAPRGIAALRGRMAKNFTGSPELRELTQASLSRPGVTYGANMALGGGLGALAGGEDHRLSGALAGAGLGAAGVAGSRALLRGALKDSGRVIHGRGPLGPQAGMTNMRINLPQAAPRPPAGNVHSVSDPFAASVLHGPAPAPRAPRRGDARIWSPGELEFPKISVAQNPAFIQGGYVDVDGPSGDLVTPEQGANDPAMGNSLDGRVWGQKKTAFLGNLARLARGGQRAERLVGAGAGGLAGAAGGAALSDEDHRLRGALLGGAGGAGLGALGGGALGTAMRERAVGDAGNMYSNARRAVDTAQEQQALRQRRLWDVVQDEAGNWGPRVDPGNFDPMRDANLMRSLSHSRAANVPEVANAPAFGRGVVDRAHGGLVDVETQMGDPVFRDLYYDALTKRSNVRSGITQTDVPKTPTFASTVRNVEQRTYASAFGQAKEAMEKLARQWTPAQRKHFFKSLKSDGKYRTEAQRAEDAKYSRAVERPEVSQKAA